MNPDNPTFTFQEIHLEETDSTSDYLVRLCDEQNDQLPNFTTVTADFQTAGKGQKGNRWEAEKGKNLLFSFVVYPGFMPVKEQFYLSQLVSLSLKKVLDRYTHHITIKWPNDIYYKEKKICGFLTEVYIQGGGIGRCINGIGLNINQDDFISDAPNPVSLKQILGKKLSLREVLNQIMHAIADSYRQLEEQPEAEKRILMRNYRKALFRSEGFFPYRDKQGLFMGKVVTVEPDGTLVLKDKEGGLRRYLFKEVQYVL